jgi:GAF domain-containing protein
MFKRRLWRLNQSAGGGKSTMIAAVALDPKVALAKQLIELIEERAGAVTPPGTPIKEIVDILVSGASSPEFLLEKLITKLHSVLDSDVSYIGLVAEVNGKLRVVVDKKDKHVVAQVGMDKNYLFDVPVGKGELSPEDRTLTGYVAATRTSQCIGNVQKWKDESGGFYREGRPGVKSELAVPVLFEERSVLAVMNFESRIPNKFGPEDLKLIQWVAGVISGALEAIMNRTGYRKPYLSTLDKVNEQLNHLRTNAALDSQMYLSKDCRDVFNRICRLVAGGLRSNVCRIYLSTDDKKQPTLAGEHSNGTSREAEKEIELIKKSIDRRLIFREDFKDEAVLIAPMFSRTESYGAIIVTSKYARPHTKSHYSLGDERLLDVFQQQIATRLDLLKQEWVRRRAASERRAIVADLLGVFTDLNEETILNSAIFKIMESCGVPHCSIFLLDERTGQLRRVATSPLPPSLESKTSYKPGEGLTGWSLSYGKPVILKSRFDEDLANVIPSLSLKKLKVDPLLRSRPYMAIPILLREKVIGVIRCSDKRSGVFTEADEELVSLIASHLAATLDFRKYHEPRMTMLNNILQLTIEMAKIDPLSDVVWFEEVIYRETLKAAHRTFRADLAVWHRYMNGSFQKPIWEGVALREDFMNATPDETSLIFPFMKSENQQIYFPDSQEESSLADGELSRGNIVSTGRFVVRENIKSSFGVRLQAGTVPKGVLFMNYRHRRNFNDQFHDMVTSFTLLTGLCFEIAELWKRSISAAAEISGDIVPQIHVGVRERAARGLKHVKNKQYNSVEHDLKEIDEFGKWITVLLGHTLQGLCSPAST